MNKLEQLAVRAIADEVFPGCSIAVLRRGEAPRFFSFGRFGYEPDSASVDEFSVYDLASVTKSLPVASIALKLLQGGELCLDQSVSEVIPEFQPRFAEEVRLEHLLTHTLDYSFSLSSLRDKRPDKILNHIFNYRFQTPPGKRYLYCNSTSIVLGIFLENFTATPLPQLAQTWLFDPLEMIRSGFAPLDFSDRPAIVPTEDDPWRGKIMQGEVHDESAWALQKILQPGSAGLFSCSADLAKFLGMLLDKGLYKGRRVLGSDVLDLLSRNRLKEIDQSAALGWELQQVRFMGRHASEQCFGKTGFTGCSVCVEPEKGIAWSVLSNFTWPRREESADRINEFRRAVADVVLSNHSLSARNP